MEYILSIFGRGWAENGTLSVFMGAWLPNFTLFPFCLLFLRQAQRGRGLFLLNLYELRRRMKKYLRENSISNPSANA